MNMKLMVAAAATMASVLPVLGEETSSAKALADGAVLTLAFDDAANPLRDDFGQGKQLRVYKNAPSPLAVKDDAERGKVGYSDGSTFIWGTAEKKFSLTGLPDPKKEFTVALWVRPEPSDTPQEILGWGHFGKTGIWKLEKAGLKANSFVRLFVDDMKTFGGAFHPQATGMVTSSFGKDLTADGKWHFVALVAEGRRVRIYVDDVSKVATGLREGKADAGDQQVSCVARNANFTLLASPVSRKAYKGWLDDLIILPRAVSADELAKIKDGSWKKRPSAD